MGESTPARGNSEEQKAEETPSENNDKGGDMITPEKQSEESQNDSKPPPPPENDKDKDKDLPTVSSSSISSQPSKREQNSSCPRPIKRARTAYFIFSDEHRAQVRAEHPGESVGVVAKALGQKWAAMTAEEKEVYTKKAAEERQRVAEQMQEVLASAGDLPDTNSTTAAHNLILPVGRIRKIAKLDPEVRGISKEAMLLITKCAELATVKLGKESVRVAQIQNRRKLLADDVAQVCQTREQFLFLKHDIKDLVADQLVQQKSVRSKNANDNKPSHNVKPLTEYFSNVKKD